MKLRVTRQRAEVQTEPADNRLFARLRRVAPATRQPEEVAALLDEARTPDEQVAVILAQLGDTVATHPLPFRDELEALFGFPLPEGLRVLYGPEISPWLAALDVTALAAGQTILLAEARPDLLTVAHEVVHVLQANEALPEQVTLIPLQDPAEQEAEAQTARLAARAAQDTWEDFLPVAVEAEIAPGTAAANRAAVAPAPVADETAARREFEQQMAVHEPETESEQAATQEAEREASTPEETTQAETEARAPTPETTASTEAETETGEAPELPPAPEPGVTEEDMAARREALAQAEAALAGAEDADGVVDAYATAPPTIKARESGNLQDAINEKVQAKEETFQEELPDFHAQMNLQSEEVETREVAPPGASGVTVEQDAPGPAPEVELPPTPDPGEYTANEGVIANIRALIGSWFGEDRARQVGSNLRAVRTTDSEVSASPGEPPRVPLEGEADPARVESQRDETVAQSRAQRDAAQQAVLDGPGPEQVQPRNMDEAVEMDELEQPSVDTALDPAGPDAYLQLGLPEEVDAAFDQANQQEMAAGMAEAREQVSTATQQRDEQREQAVNEAETQAETLNEQADNEQRQAVSEARETIQTERQTTMQAQHDAVQAMEGEVETRRAADQQAIQERVEADEAQIAADYDQAERDAQTEIDAGEQQAEAEKREAEREAENQSWWDRAVDFVKSAFEALTAAINAIFDAVRAAVNRILDAVKAAATALIRAAADFVKAAISAFGEFLKAAVNTLLAETFPGLARALNEAIDGAVALAHQAVDAVADTLIAGIEALVEGLRGALNAILDAFQAALNTALQIIQAAITGDWGTVLRLAFEAVLRVAGIDPESIYQFIGRAMETFQIILDDPLGFVGNLFDAFIGGVRQFADNFLGHLQAGIIGWLTGALGPAGITLPERFDLMGVLDIVRQVLGFTWENIRSRAVRIVGETAVQVLEFVYGYVETLITGGWQALWDQIMSDLAGLRDMIFDQIKEFVLTRLIMAAVTRLATMFNPVGAIVNLIIMAYQFFTFLRDNIQRMVQLITTVVDAIGNIARGVLGPAMDRVESTLAQFLPMAIDLVARLIGLGNVGERVRRIISGIQDRIWGAIDRMIERVMRMFRGRGDAATPDTEAEAEGGPANQIGERLPIPAPDGTHYMTVEVSGNDATFVVRSEPQTIDQLIAMWRGRLGEDSPIPADQQERATTLLNQLDSAEDDSERTIESLLRDSAITPEDNSTAANEQRELLGMLRELFQIFGLEGVQAGADQVRLLFAEELEAADDNARQDLEPFLVAHAEEVIQDGQKRPNWRALVEPAEFYQKPLLQETYLGRATRTVMRPWVAAQFEALNDPAAGRTVEPPADFNRFHGSRVGLIHSRGTDFPQSLSLVREQIFNGSLRYTTDQNSPVYDEYGTSIEHYVEGPPTPHGEYEPIELQRVDLGNTSVHTYTYREVRVRRQDGSVTTVRPPVFTAVLRDGRVRAMSGFRIRFKEVLDGIQSGQRGRMQSPPDYDSNLFLNRSHLVADEFMGSAFANSGNVVVTSDAYNQIIMRAAERNIARTITDRANAEAGGEARPEDIDFDLQIVVTYAQSVFDEAIQEQMEREFENLLRQNQAVVEDIEALKQQWTRVNLTLAFKTQNVQPVRRVRYTVTARYNGAQITRFDRELGPDIYLGMSIDVVRRVFRAAGVVH
ncbi:MAG: hypothetical protein Kow0077_23060 [Anaerolineae bacterium]